MSLLLNPLNHLLWGNTQYITLASTQLHKILEGCNGALALRKGTASIEIVRDNKLERIYFQRPRICKQLSPVSKKNLLHNVNR